VGDVRKTVHLSLRPEGDWMRLRAYRAALREIVRGAEPWDDSRAVRLARPILEHFGELPVEEGEGEGL